MKNQKLAKENLLESTPESSEAEDVPKVPQKQAKDNGLKKDASAGKSVEPKKVEGGKAPHSKDKAAKEVPRKESGHSHKDESKPVHAKAAEDQKLKKAPKKEEVPAPKKDKEAKAPKKEESVAKKDKAPKKEEKPKADEDVKLGKRDAPAKPAAAPKKESKVKEISDDSSDESEEEKPAKKAPKKEEKVAKKAEKKSEGSASNSKKVSFNEPDSSAAETKNKKVKTAAVAQKDAKPAAKTAAPAKKEEPSKVNKMKQALKKQESSSSEQEESEEMEIEQSESEEASEEMEVEEPQPEKKRKASVEKQAAQRKLSAEKPAPPRKASAEKAAPAFQQQAKPAFGRQDNGQGKFGPEFEVIVFGLPFSSSENDIRAHFGKCPDLKFVKVMMGHDGRPRGKAFVKFSSENGMNAALELSGSSLGGRSITVELTDKMKGGQGGQGGQFGSGNQGSYNPPPQNGEIPENTNVMVKNLAFTVDEAKLQNVFAGCGAIKAVRVCKDETGRSRGFGFVDFMSIESARNALKKANEKIDGRPINVLYSMPRDKSAPRQGGYAPRPQFGAEKKGNLTQFTGEAVDLD